MLPTKAEWDKPGVAAEVRKRVEDDGADVNEAGPDGRTVLMNAAAFSADPEANLVHPASRRKAPRG